MYDEHAIITGFECKNHDTLLKIFLLKHNLFFWTSKILPLNKKLQIKLPVHYNFKPYIINSQSWATRSGNVLYFRIKFFFTFTVSKLVTLKVKLQIIEFVLK